MGAVFSSRAEKAAENLQMEVDKVKQDVNRRITKKPPRKVNLTTNRAFLYLNPP